MATKCSKFSALKGIAEAKKKRNRPEVGLRVRGRGIRNVAELAAAEIKGMGLSVVERTGTAAAEDGELVAGLVDGTVAIDALRNGESGAAGMSGGDDYVTNGGTKGFEAPLIIRANQIMDLGVRPPYFKFPRNPTN
jgi:hypothetical protein